MRCDEGKGAVIRDEEHTKVGEKRLQKPVEAASANGKTAEVFKIKPKLGIFELRLDPPLFSTQQLSRLLPTSSDRTSVVCVLSRSIMH